MNFINGIGQFLAWVIGGIFCLLGLLFVFDIGVWLIGIILLAIGIAVVPPSLKNLPVGRNAHPFVKGVSILGLGLIVFVITALVSLPRMEEPKEYTAQELEEIAKHTAEGEKQRVAAQAEIEKEFRASRAHIIKMLRDLINDKAYIAAVAWGERFAKVQDKEFQKLYKEAQRLNGLQQADMSQKMEAKKSRLDKLQNVNVNAESAHAIAYCQNLVRNELKSPVDAKFPWDTDVRVTDTNEKFTVISYVDAPNSYNAKIRTRYLCRLNYNGGGSSGWNIEEFRIGD